MPGILVLGDINIDVLMRVLAYPPPGGEALTERIDTRLGGSAANTAVVLSRLGLDVRMLGRVGGDTWGQIALGELAQAGVSIDLVQQDEAGSTGMMFTVITPDGERTMIGQRGANRGTDPDALALNIFTSVNYFHLSGYALLEAPQSEAAVRAVELAAQLGVAISLDTAYLPALSAPQALRPLLPFLDACILGLPEASTLLGEAEPHAAASALLDAGVRLAAIKLGAKGCLLANAASVHLIPAFTVQVVDTTGAGDAFTAGIIYGRQHGLSLPALGLLANALGGLAASVHGAGTALPGKIECAAFLREGMANAPGHISEALQSLS